MISAIKDARVYRQLEHLLFAFYSVSRDLRLLFIIIVWI